MGKIVGDHSLYEADFDQYIKDFVTDYHLPSAPVGKWIATVDMETTLAQGTCRQGKLKIWTEKDAGEDDPGKPETNDDILYKFDTSTGAASAYYSYALFRGVIDIYKPDGFYLYKAKKNGDIVFVFKAIAATKAVYFGDLSELYP